MKDYAGAVAAQIRNKRLRRLLEAELSGHVADKAALYRERGFDPAAAEEKADADMGDEADAVAVQLKKVHRAVGVGDVLFALFLLGFTAQEALSRYAQLFAERDALYMYVDWETQPPYHLGLPWLVLGSAAIFALYHLCVLAVSLRRRYLLAPLLCAVSVAVCGRFQFAVPAALRAVLGGEGREFFFRWANFYLFAQDGRPLVLSAVLYGAAAAMPMAVFLLNLLERRTLPSKKLRRARRRLRAAVFAVPLSALALYGALAVGVCTAERTPQLTMFGTVCVLATETETAPSEAALRETFGFALGEHWEDFAVSANDGSRQWEAFDVTVEKKLEPCCGWLCSPVKEVVCVPASPHAYYFLSVFNGEQNDVYGRTHMESQRLLLPDPDGRRSFRWSTEIWDYRLTITKER